MDVDDGGGANCREQTSLKMRSTLSVDKVTKETHKNQGGIKISIVLLQVFGIVLDRLSIVYSVEIELGIMGWRYIPRASWMLCEVSSLVPAADSKSLPERTIEVSRINFATHRGISPWRWIEEREYAWMVGVLIIIVDSGRFGR